MAWLILVVEVIHRIDEADTEEQAPVTIDGRPGEPRIFAGRDPVGQSAARRRLGRPRRLLAVEEHGPDGLLALDRHQLALAGRLGQRGEQAVAAPLDAGEEGSLLPELLPGPAGERMIVALGAFELDAEEGARDGGGEVLWLRLLGREERQRVRLPRLVEDRLRDLRVGGDRCGKQFADETVVADVAPDSLPQPGLEAGLEVLCLATDRRL